MNARKIVLVFISIGYSFFSAAQIMTNNNVLISISPTAQITVKGGVQNNSGTTITNNGNIQITGDWINNSGNNCFGTSQGTVTLNGSNQYISGNTQTIFNNLILTGGTKTMQVATTTGGGNVTPVGILNCNNAVLDLNSNILTVNNPNCGAISNTTGFILSEDADNSSKVLWKTGFTTGLYNIPFGNSSNIQIPLAINITSGNLGDVTVSTYQTIANNTPYPAAPTLVTNLLSTAGTDNSANTVDRFWQIDRTGNGQATYTFNYAPTENAANGNTALRAQCWNNSTVGWEPALAGQVNPTAQSVVVPAVAKSGAWTLSLQSSPLPVELLSFSATVKDNIKVICNWNTASEKNNDYFIVMRSTDGISFEEIGNVDGAGNSNTVIDYTFTDFNPYIGVSYYRLKQVDFNGDVSFSKTVSILITDKEIKYAIYPNPSTGNFFIQYTVDENMLNKYVITDATGRFVCGGVLTDLSGIQQIALPAVMKGFYFLKITHGDKMHFNKLEVIN